MDIRIDVCMDSFAQFVAVCRTSKMVATVTRRPRRGSGSVTKRWLSQATTLHAYSGPRLAVPLAMTTHNPQCHRSSLHVLHAEGCWDRNVPQPFCDAPSS